MEKIAIIGCGLIGRAWAIVFARSGHAVKLYDNVSSAAEKAVGLIQQSLEELSRFGLIQENPATVLARITTAVTLQEAVAEADYVQENTSEQVETKREVFRQLDAAAPPNCILASSTSTIQTSRFTENLTGRHRCLVAHPVNPPHVVPLVEISPAPWTSAEVVSRARQLQEKVGQVAITVRKEVPGFILNRLQAAVLLEAWRLVKEDFATVEDVDKCVRDGLGLRWSFMGPFETIDLNAPGGLVDYAQRYGGFFYEMMKFSKPERWEEEGIAKIGAARREHLPQSQLADREAWRDRRLMALIKHKREQPTS